VYCIGSVHQERGTTVAPPGLLHPEPLQLSCYHASLCHACGKLASGRSGFRGCEQFYPRFGSLGGAVAWRTQMPRTPQRTRLHRSGGNEGRPASRHNYRRGRSSARKGEPSVWLVAVDVRGVCARAELAALAHRQVRHCSWRRRSSTTPRSVARPLHAYSADLSVWELQRRLVGHTILRIR
jgi:hypothetical protein